MSTPLNNLLLLPRPRSLRMFGGFVHVSPLLRSWGLRKIDCIRMTALPPGVSERVTGGWCGADPREAESFTLRVESDETGNARVTLTSPTIAGIRHARGAFAQVLRQFPDLQPIPTFEIHDRPAIASRGVMLDISRCRIPTMEEFLKTILPQLAALRCNHLQLYTEHTFAYGFAHAREVWEGWSPITPSELRTLDVECRARGIELVANQNCFGHLRQWLENSRFGHLAETHGDWLFDVWPRSGPFSLCPTDDRSIKFVRSLLDELLPCVQSGMVNIGCDETYDIAYGRSRDAVAGRGRGTVFAEFVTEIAAAAREHGKRSMFWADIALSDPASLPNLPADLIPLAWGYEPDAPWERWCEALRGRWSDGPVWLCPGTSSWRSLTGRTAERRGNIDGAVAAAERHGAGILACDWGDSGHWQTWPIALHGLTDALTAAWEGASGATPSRETLLEAESLHMFGDETLCTARWLEALGDAGLPLRRECMPLSRPGASGALRNQSAVFADLFQPWKASLEIGALHHWVETTEHLHHMRQTRPRLPSTLLEEEMEHMAAFAFQAAARGRVRRMENDDRGAAAGQRRAFQELREQHGRLWPLRSRPGGQLQSAAFFDRIDWGESAS